MSKPKKQHYVPQCYLREFVDPLTPAKQEPYVWVFTKDGKHKERRAPKNVFHETDLYRLEIHGQKDYVIERSLSALEGDYARVVREKIKKHLPLAEAEYVTLCAFIAAMMQRTLRFKENIQSVHDQLIEKVEAIERVHGIDPKKSLELRESKERAHKIGVLQQLPELTRLLFQMNVAFLCTDGSGSSFITSDDPVTLFNPDLQWQQFYGPGLAQKNVEVTMPISPEIAACLTWSNFRGYIWISQDRVDEMNRRTRGHAHEYFVVSSARAKWIWFSRLPYSIPFLFTAARHLTAAKLRDIKQYWRFRRYRYGRRK
jgi:hypothetical protein